MMSSANLGTIRPRILFENGLIVDRSEWSWIQSSIAENSNCVFHNRAPKNPLKALLQAIDPFSQMNRLRSAGVAFHDTKPHILVGHSVGGLLAQCYAALDPKKTRALVLVDPTVPLQFVHSERQLNSYLWLNQRLFNRALVSPFRRGISTAEVKSVSMLPSDAIGAATDNLQSSGSWITAYRESRAASRSWSDVASAMPRRSMLCHILLSEEATKSDSRYLKLIDRLAEGFQEVRVDVVPKTSHESIVMDQDSATAVAEAISALTARVSEG